MRQTTLTLFPLLLAACTTDPAPYDTNSGRDAAIATDSAIGRDASARDTGSGSDTGPVDSGSDLVSVTDADVDTGTDASADASVDTSVDTSVDASVDTARADAAPAPCAELALTTTDYVGTAVISREWADGECVAEFGANWHWYEWHSLGRGTDVWRMPVRWRGATIPLRRGWVGINDQQAECFESVPPVPAGPHYGLTMAAGASTGRCGAHIECADPRGDLVGDEYHWRGGVSGCNPYEGDTPCTYSRPLVCYQLAP